MKTKSNRLASNHEEMRGFAGSSVATSSRFIAKTDKLNPASTIMNVPKHLSDRRNSSRKVINNNKNKIKMKRRKPEKKTRKKGDRPKKNA